MAKRSRDDDTPKGGWLGPPSASSKVPALAVVTGSSRGKWKWKTLKLSGKDLTRREKFEKKLKQADKEGRWKI